MTDHKETNDESPKKSPPKKIPPPMNPPPPLEIVDRGFGGRTRIVPMPFVDLWDKYKDEEGKEDEKGAPDKAESS